MRLRDTGRSYEAVGGVEDSLAQVYSAETAVFQHEMADTRDANSFDSCQLRKQIEHQTHHKEQSHGQTAASVRRRDVSHFAGKRDSHMCRMKG